MTDRFSRKPGSPEPDLAGPGTVGEDEEMLGSQGRYGFFEFLALIGRDDLAL